MSKLVIFDLDDTIFETKSIGEETVKTIFTAFRKVLNTIYSEIEIEAIIADLWSIPFDAASEKHRFSTNLKESFAQLIQSATFEFDISPFPDFDLIHQLTASKILVTTGFEDLQWAKIEALKIGHHFEHIHIDDILDPGRIYKKGLFENIRRSYPKKTKLFVIGDNPNSELKAANELGISSIQMAKLGQEKSVFTNYYVTSYQEVVKIING